MTSSQVTYHKQHLRIAEAWFDQTPQYDGCDLLLQCRGATPLRGGHTVPKHTLLLDLTHGEEHLFGLLASHVRSKIRRARESDRCLCEALDAADCHVRLAFREFFDRFARERGLAALDRVHLEALSKAGALDISLARGPEDQVLVYHSHLLTRTRVRVLQSASLFREVADSQRRNLIGRANCYLHWSDMLRFKAAGYTTYDWGGYYMGQTDEAKLRINRFKREFGGTLVEEYNSVLGVTLKGRIALLVHRLLKGSWLEC